MHGEGENKTDVALVLFFSKKSHKFYKISG